MTPFVIFRYTLKCALTLSSTLVNLGLIVATIRSKSLRSSCNSLLAIDGCFVLMMQSERLVHLVVAGVWQTVTMRSCFLVLFVPSLGMECSQMIQSVIALDRFLHVFFPFWSKTVDKKLGYYTAMLCLTVFAYPTIFLTQNAVEVLDASIANKDVTCTFGDLYSTKAAINSHINTLVIMLACGVFYATIWLRLKMFAVGLQSQGSEQINRKLLISLCVIVTINLVGWVTPAIASMILIAMNLNAMDYGQIFGMVADTCIELGSCAMCPALYAIKTKYLAPNIVRRSTTFSAVSFVLRIAAHRFMQSTTNGSRRRNT